MPFQCFSEVCNRIFHFKFAVVSGCQAANRFIWAINFELGFSQTQGWLLSTVFELKTVWAFPFCSWTEVLASLLEKEKSQNLSTEISKRGAGSIPAYLVVLGINFRLLSKLTVLKAVHIVMMQECSQPLLSLVVIKFQENCNSLHKWSVDLLVLWLCLP